MSADTAAAERRTGANERQVGGNHYKTGGLEHWDVVHDADVPYLLGCASKYVARHHLKDGREALEKATHYLEKWEERVGSKTCGREWRVFPDNLLTWCSFGNLRGPEVHILFQLLCYSDVKRALELLRELLELRYPEKTNPVASPQIKQALIKPITLDGQSLRNFLDTTEPLIAGTPEDGGHHARQVEDEVEEPEEFVNLTRNGPFPLPESISRHEFQHRCDETIQRCYEYQHQTARYHAKFGVILTDALGGIFDPFIPYTYAPA